MLSDVGSQHEQTIARDGYYYTIVNAFMKVRGRNVRVEPLFFQKCTIVRDRL